MGTKRYKQVHIEFSQDMTMIVKASENDMFGAFSISINYGICYIYEKNNLIAAASKFVLGISK